MFFSSNLLSQATKFLLSRIHICQPTEKISDNQTLSSSSSTKNKKKTFWNVFCNNLFEFILHFLCLWLLWLLCVCILKWIYKYLTEQNPFAPTK